MGIQINLSDVSFVHKIKQCVALHSLALEYLYMPLSFRKKRTAEHKRPSKHQQKACRTTAKAILRMSVLCARDQRMLAECPRNICRTSRERPQNTGSTPEKIRQNNESKAISCWWQKPLYAYLSCKKLFQLSLLLFLTIRSKKIRKSQKITLRYTVSTWLNL